MSNQLATELSTLKERYIEIGKSIARHESSIQMLEERKTELTERCNVLGVKPEELTVKLNQLETSLSEIVTEIKETLDNKPTEEEITAQETVEENADLLIDTPDTQVQDTLLEEELI